MDNHFDVPTIDVRDRIQDNVIHMLARRIVDRFKPQKIILFGSYAYGKPRPESDIDLLVIVEFAKRESQQAMQIRQYLNPLFGLDVIVYSPAKIKQRIIDTEHALGLHMGRRYAPQHIQSRLVQARQRKWAFGQQTVQRALVAALHHQQAVDPIDCLVFAYQQPTDIAFELDQRFR